MMDQSKVRVHRIGMPPPAGLPSRSESRADAPASELASSNEVCAIEADFVMVSPPADGGNAGEVNEKGRVKGFYRFAKKKPVGNGVETKPRASEAASVDVVNAVANQPVGRHCARCGHSGHSIDMCYAKRNAYGCTIDDSNGGVVRTNGARKGYSAKK